MKAYDPSILSEFLFAHVQTKQDWKPFLRALRRKTGGMIVNRDTVLRWADGRRVPQPTALWALAAVMEVPVETLMKDR